MCSWKSELLTVKTCGLIEPGEPFMSVLVLDISKLDTVTLSATHGYTIQYYTRGNQEI